MPLTAHLEELRWRLVKSLLAVTVAFIAAYNFADLLFAFLTRPLIDLNLTSEQGDTVHLIGTGVVEGKFPRRALAHVLEWYGLHRAELETDWELAAEGEPLQDIPPLE